MIDPEKIKNTKFLRVLPEELRNEIIKEVEELSSKTPSSSEVDNQIKNWANKNRKEKGGQNGK